MIDIDVVRTFLSVIESGTFQGASEQVHVTQSTVSSRIKTLEDRLGQIVFERSKAGATLTIAGRNFERYARAMVRAWEQGRHHAGVPGEYDALLVIGGQYSLWNQLLTQWFVRLRKRLPNVAFRAEAGSSVSLGQQLADGLIDIAVMHQPWISPDIEVEELIDDELVLVTTAPDGAFEDRYMFIDWGQSFREQHARKFPEFFSPRTHAGLGFFGANLLITAEAAGYMPRRLVQPHIEEGFLFPGKDAPTFSYPIYVAYQAGMESDQYNAALKSLRATAKAYTRGSLDGPFWVEDE